MNHSFLRKTKIASAIALASASLSANAFEITVTQMNFSGIYAATGTVYSDNTDGPGSFTGSFFGHTWVADQVTDVIDNTGSWSGSNSLGAFDYATGISNMTDGQFAVGTLFDWSTSLDIPVLAVFECTAAATPPAVCTGINDTVGGEMQTGPFAGSTPAFNGTGADFDPVAADDPVGAVAGAAFEDFDIVANDTDIDEANGNLSAASFTIQIPVTSTQGGTLTDLGGGVVRYVPPGSLMGGDSDSFTYTVTDSAPTSNVSNTATVNISITDVPNTAPVSAGATIVTPEDTPIEILVTDVATDGEGDTMTFSAFDATTTQGGTITVNVGNNVLEYTPAQDFNDSMATDSFTFQAFDGVAASAVITQNISVTAVNDAPVCPAASLATDADTVLTVSAAELVASCTDVENDTVTYVALSATQPTNAMLADDGAGSLTITPNAGFVGDAVFQIEATDGGTGGQVIIPVTVKVGTIFSNFTMMNEGGDTIGGTNDIIFEWDGTYNTDEADANFGKMTIVSAGPQPFNSFLWQAHHVRVYPEGSYSFDTSCSSAQYDAGTTDCGGSVFITMTVGAGQVGGHILFNWGRPEALSPCGVANCDIDVVNVWDVDGVWDRHGGTSNVNKLFDGPAGVAPDPETTWELVSTDVTGYTDVNGVLQADGNNINGAPMVDGPFGGFYANFNSTPGASITGSGEPTSYSQRDTELDSALASMNIVALFGSLLALFGLRNIRRKQ